MEKEKQQDFEYKALVRGSTDQLTCLFIKRGKGLAYRCPSTHHYTVLVLDDYGSKPLVGKDRSCLVCAILLVLFIGSALEDAPSVVWNPLY